MVCVGHVRNGSQNCPGSTSRGGNIHVNKMLYKIGCGIFHFLFNLLSVTAMLRPDIKYPRFPLLLDTPTVCLALAPL